MPEHLVVTRLFDVKNLSFEREDGLEASITPLLGRPSGGFSLYEKKLAPLRLFFRAVRQLARKAAAVECTFAPGEVASFPGSFAGAGGLNRFVDDLSSDSWILLEIGSQPLIHKCLHYAGDVGVQFAFGLSLKLRLRQLYADHSNQAFTHIVTGEIFLYVLEQAHLLASVVDGAG